jgi:hypothetical protein
MRAIYLRGTSSVLGRVVDLLLITDLIAGVAAVIALLLLVFAWQIFLPLSICLAMGCISAWQCCARTNARHGFR